MNQSTKSCDTLYNFGDFGRIIIEHGANLSIKKESKYDYSLYYHVKNEAEKYHLTIKPDETWVIHWTTVDSKTYYFPESQTVSTLHVYHDKIFHELKVVTKNKVEIIENALPKMESKRKKELFEEPEKKKVEIEEKYITIRKYGQSKGGEEIKLPKDITTLIKGGGEKLGIEAINIRREGTLAKISDINGIKHNDILYLTTEKNEIEFK